MFGYVVPFKPEMKIREFDVYKAVYCGLCKQMGRDFGAWSRMTLSYDFSFLALLSLSVSETESCLQQQRCLLNPLKKKPCLCSCADLSYTGAAAMTMVYFKVRDDLHDRGFGKKLRAALIYPLVSRAVRKARKCYPQVYEAFADMSQRQSLIEDGCTASADAACEPTAQALSVVTRLLLPDADEARQRILSRLGYLLGRYVYLCDALDDLDDDLARGNYNPFLYRYSLSVPADLTEQVYRTIKEETTGILNMTAGEIANAYNLLDLKKYKPILDNIIFLGLQHTVSQIFAKREKQNGSV